MPAKRSVERAGSAATLRADEARKLVDAAGLRAEDVWGEGVLETAIGNLVEVKETVDADGVISVVETPRRKAVGNLGYDMTFTFPKSYSVLMAFASWCAPAPTQTCP